MAITACGTSLIRKERYVNAVAATLQLIAAFMVSASREKLRSIHGKFTFGWKESDSSCSPFASRGCSGNNDVVAALSSMHDTANTVVGWLANIDDGRIVVSVVQDGVNKAGG